MQRPTRSQNLPDSHPRKRDRDRERDKPARRASRGATPHRKGGGRQIPGWLWLIAGLGGGMLMASLMLTLVRSDSSAQPATAGADTTKTVAPLPTPAKIEKDAPAKEPVATDDPGVAAEEVEPATRFDFYTLLPEREVIVPEREPPAATPAPTAKAPAAVATAPVAASPAPSAAAPSSAAATTSAGSESYLLQAGSFRGSAEAERRRSQIAALGLQVRVEKVRAGADTLYRVNAGPFRSRDQLAGARSQLSAEGIETLQIRQK